MPLTIWLNNMVKQQKDINAETKILNAAKKVFLQKGMAGARMQDIADEAGINKALLHYYFRSKEKLFEVIFKEAFAKFWPEVFMLLNSDEDLFTKIKNFVERYISLIAENQYLPLFVLNEMNKQPASFVNKLFGGHKPDFSKLIAQIEKEKRKGIIKSINPIHLIVNMISMCIFPFVSKPMIQKVMELDELQFRYLIEERKKIVPEFIINAIKK